MPGQAGEQAGSGQTGAAAEPGVCGGRRESYLGTFKGTYKREPATGVLKPTFEGDFADALGQMANYAESGSWDLTARFFMDGTTRRVEATFQRGNATHTEVHEYVVNLNNRSVEFNAHAEATPDSGEEFDYQVEEPGVSKKGHLGGISTEYNVAFALSAAEPRPGTDIPLRLYQNRTDTRGMRHIVELRRVE
ncbi:hypothetical protein ACFVT2_39325 [Streptomyces sp. NPDC058000]|uniref:hypothetical protein n=1 Tax=Streptomyces sp. NPDC058000 TaxID=3346299 RepID=UPI0036ED3658